MDDCLMRSRSKPSNSALFPVFDKKILYPDIGTRVSLIGFTSKTHAGLLEVERCNKCSQAELDAHLMTGVIQLGWKKKRRRMQPRMWQPRLKPKLRSWLSWSPFSFLQTSWLTWIRTTSSPSSLSLNSSLPLIR